MAHVERPAITVTVMWSVAPGQIETETLHLPAGSTVPAACAASALLRHGLGGIAQPGLPDAPAGLLLGLWGRLCPPDTVLQDDDRLELLRPLQLDPMEARRQRLRRDGLRKPQRGPRRPRAA